MAKVLWVYLNESDQAVGNKGSFPPCQGSEMSFKNLASPTSAERGTKKAGARSPQKYLKPSLLPMRRKPVEADAIQSRDE